MNHSEIVSFLWGVADLIRDTFKRGKYQDVILPLTVLRRLDCVLADTKEKVLGKQAELKGKKLENLDPQLRKVAGFAFYNTSRYDFAKLLADAPHLAVHLMVDLMLAGDETEIRAKKAIRTVYDPCCGSGGMLMITKEHITIGLRKNGELLRPPINKDAEIHLFGQEVNPETWAVSKSDLFMKDPTGRDADHITYGSTLSHDRHAGTTFDYLIANPPYGKDWKRDEDAVRAEHDRGTAGRFSAGLPRISDGQLLFLLHMLAHARGRKEGGSRIAIIMNGSPLFTGDAGSGESEIRRF